MPVILSAAKDLQFFVFTGILQMLRGLYPELNKLQILRSEPARNEAKGSA